MKEKKQNKPITPGEKCFAPTKLGIRFQQRLLHNLELRTRPASSGAGAGKNLEL